MEEIKTIIGYIESIGFVGLLILLAVPRSRKFLGFNGNGKYQSQIDLLSDHAKTANEEMSHIKEDIAVIRGDLEFIKGKLSK